MAIENAPLKDKKDGHRWSRFLSTEDYVAGLTAIAPRMNELQRRLLECQYYAPKHTAYASQLAEWASVKGHPVVNSQYGRLGRIFCEATGFEADYFEDDRRWWSVWSLGYHTPKGYKWEMLPQVAEALERLGWVSPMEFSLPDELVPGMPYVEGAVTRISVNAYERNPVARRRCIEHYGASCFLCGFNFGAVYGVVADGYIHVHHLRPLSEIAGEYTVDPIEDLRPVCPNCHAVIHLGQSGYSLGEVKDFLEREAPAGSTRPAE